LIVIEGLSRAVLEYKSRGTIKGIKIRRTLYLTHLSFIDNILLFINGSLRETKNSKRFWTFIAKLQGWWLTIKSLISPLMEF
jgi:hypothetical protein